VYRVVHCTAFRSIDTYLVILRVGQTSFPNVPIFVGLQMLPRGVSGVFEAGEGGAAAAAAAEANGEVLPEARKRVSVYRDYKATGVSFFLFFHGKLKS